MSSNKKRKSDAPAVVAADGASAATATNSAAGSATATAAPAAAAATSNGDSKDSKTTGATTEKPNWQIPGSPCHIEIPAHDLARVSTFFADAFGWKCTPWGSDYVMWSTDGLGGGFFKTDEPIAAAAGPHRTVSFAIFANDIPAALVKVEACGGTVTRHNTVIAEGVGAWASFQDTEGNAHSVFSGRTDNVVAVAATLEQRVLLAMSPRDAYETLLDAKKHTAVAGAPCTVERRVNGAFAVNDGYAVGRTALFEPDTKLVQSWRVNVGPHAWPVGHWSSVTFAFEPVAGHPNRCVVALTHAGIPKAFADGMDQGWFEYYWKRMALVADLTQRPSTSGWVYRIGTAPQYAACEKLGKLMPCDEELAAGALTLFTANQVRAAARRHFQGNADTVVFRVCTTKAAEVGQLKWEYNKAAATAAIAAATGAGSAAGSATAAATSAPASAEPPAERKPMFYPKAGVKECSVPWAAIDSMIRLPWDAAKQTHVFPADFA